MTRGDTALDASTSRFPRDDTDDNAAIQQTEAQANVGDAERVVSVTAGAIAAVAGLGRGGLPGLLIAAIGGGLIYRGATGHCPVYERLDVNTAEDGEQSQLESSRAVHLATAFLINRSPQELYDFWRDFENLPKIMTHIESVRKLDDDGKRTHWVAKSTSAGKQFEWDAEITAEESGRRIAWRSLPGGDIETQGEITFEQHLGDRGTNVHVSMDYVPPGGRVGHWIARMLGENPLRVVREDLRNFKRLMETGEILTIIGQPHGTCTGQGERYTESEWRPLFT